MAEIKEEEKDFIQLKKGTGIVKIGIKDENGKDTGNYLQFDLNDIELPLRLNECGIRHQKNVQWLEMTNKAIDKKQDVKGKFIVSKNQEEKIKAMREFCDKEEKALDLFLGKGGTRKLLNGRKPYYGMYEDIGEILEPIYPILEKNMNTINNLIKERYKNFTGKEVNIENVTLE